MKPLQKRTMRKIISRMKLLLILVAGILSQLMKSKLHVSEIGVESLNSERSVRLAIMMSLWVSGCVEKSILAFIWVM